MFGRSIFGAFEDDPFFSMHQQHMRHMDMFGGMGMFGGHDPRMALTGGHDEDRHRHQHRENHGQQLEMRQSRGNDLVPSGGPFDTFGLMNSMMSNMHGMMANSFRQMDAVRSDPNSHSYMQSSVMSYSNTGDGAPKVYQATTSTRQAPGGIKETRKAVRDSEAGVEKMSVGRHLNDRGHVVTRERNVRSGDLDENLDFINLDESEAEKFEDEWKQRTNQYAGRRDRQAVNSDPYRRAVGGRNPDNPYSHAAPPRRTGSKMKAIDQGRHVNKPY